ncbi:VWA domain-containing protein [Gilvimarinus sp. F26214L]|uniref:VWA domain-containing protein n=1 Tax=Gilvimarinus sp. DZF01 TaxID=3461371 RepID=UPI0040463F45
MRRARRDSGELNISFLDVICCGFGAIVLLLIIAKTVEPLVLESTAVNLDGKVAALQEELFEIRGETAVFNRDMNAKHEQLSRERERIAILRTELAELEARQAKEAQTTASSSTYRGELELALQSLTEEMERLLAGMTRQNDLIGGIPVDSEYVIFIIDTSGSMFENAWPRVMDEMVNVLDIYPEVKGLQVLNDMGEYMFPSFRNKWIPDTPGRRDAILQRLRNWNAFSNSSPVEGIQMAVRTFYDPDKKISIYVFGDDLMANHSIGQVADTIDRINRRGMSKEPLVRIHGVGFPVLFQLAAPHQQESAKRFAALMREVTQRNGGTFVGLNDYRSEQQR